MPNITVSEASTSDIPSLITLVPRSFHPVNEYIKQALPDTPKVRQWYTEIIEEEIANPNCHPLVAHDLTRDANECIGWLLLRLLSSSEKGAGFWTLHPLTPEHNVPKCRSMIDGMVEHRERLMLGKPHYLVEMFCADHDYKGKGVGSALLAKACEIADAGSYDVFVQANAGAKSFYEKFGFRVEDEVVMPGEGEYVECMMVRRTKQ